MLLFKVFYYDTLGRVGKWCSDSPYVSVIGRLMGHASSVCFALTVHLLSACRQLANAASWFIKGSAMCYHVCAIMHVKDPKLSVVRVGHHVPLGTSCWNSGGVKIPRTTLKTLSIIVLGEET